MGKRAVKFCLLAEHGGNVYEFTAYKVTWKRPEQDQANWISSMNRGIDAKIPPLPGEILAVDRWWERKSHFSEGVAKSLLLIHQYMSLH